MPNQEDKELVESLFASINVERMFKIYYFLIKMMKYRQYKPLFKLYNKENYISKIIALMSEHDSPHKFMDKLILKFKKENTRCIVYFHCLDIKFKKSDMEYLLKLMEDHECQKIIIISKFKVNPMVFNSVSAIKDDVQFFVENELLHCIVEHAFMPKFIKMTEEQKKDMLDYYDCQETDFPHILETDPIVKYYNFSVGDLLKIERYNGTPYPNIYYRVVVKNS